MDKFRKQLREITARYDVEIVGVITNIQGTHDIILDHNFYYKEQYKMEQEIMALGNINDISYRDVAIG
jgi:hypothetical protein